MNMKIDGAQPMQRSAQATAARPAEAKSSEIKQAWERLAPALIGAVEKLRLGLEGQGEAASGVAGSSYTVQPGDYLSKIAQQHGVSLDALIAANPQIKNPNLIVPGQQLKIPGEGARAVQKSSRYTVKPGDTMSSIAAKNGVSLAALIAANPQIKNPNLIFPGQKIELPSAGGSAPVGGGTPAGGVSAAGGVSNVQNGSIPGNAAGQQLAQAAASLYGNARPNGWCYRGVSDAMQEAFGFCYRGASAYMAADKLAAHPEQFTEYKGLSAADLKNLPAGAIVVWDKGAGHPHGHISIATGDGQEISDGRQRQTTRYGTSFRVFMPNEGLAK